MTTALHFGAGNIGRGFIGKLLADAGIHVTFTDVNQQIVEALHRQQSYPVYVVGEHTNIETVTHVDAVSSLSEQTLDLISQVDLITTAVGPQVLSKIAVTITQGLIKRYNENKTKTLNIIACENMIRGSSQLKLEVINQLPEQYHHWLNDKIGFVDSAVDRIVPPTDANKDNILAVTVETFSEWIVDKTQFKGNIPIINGMDTTDNLMAFIERKLLTLNTGHAITAYLGHYEKLKTIRDAILNEKIRLIVYGAMQESGNVLIRRYNFDANQHKAYINKIIQRFENPYLHDDVERVGRQPLRKLSENDRLIKPLRGTIEYQLTNQNLIIGIAAALHYRNPSDEQAVELAKRIQENGVDVTLSQLSGLPLASNEVKNIVSRYMLMENN